MAVFLCFLICIQLAAGSSRRNIRILHTRVIAVTSPLLCSRSRLFVNSRLCPDRQKMGKKRVTNHRIWYIMRTAEQKVFLRRPVL